MSTKINKKGVTPLIATALLIVIVCATATLVYVSFNWSALVPPTDTGKILENLKIVNIAPVNDSAILYIQNVGGVNATIGGVYVDDAFNSLIDEYNQNATGTIIPVGQTVPITINYGMNFSEARYYQVVTTRGNSFEYLWMAGHWSWLGYPTGTGGSGGIFPPSGNGTNPPVQHNYTYQEVYFPMSWTNQKNPLNGVLKNGNFFGSLPTIVTYNDNQTFNCTSVIGCYQGVAGTFNFIGVNQTHQITNITFVVVDSLNMTQSVNMFHYICKPDGTILSAYNTPYYSGTTSKHYYSISITDATGISKIIKNGQAAIFCFCDGLTWGMHVYNYRADQVYMVVTYYVP